MNWQLIATAPKEEDVLIWGELQDGTYLGHLVGDQWFIADVFPHQWTELLTQPTHWMPLPSAPGGR